MACERRLHQACRDRETELWWVLHQIWAIMHADSEQRFHVPTTHAIVRAVRELKARADQQAEGR